MLLDVPHAVKRHAGFRPEFGVDLLEGKEHAEVKVGRRQDQRRALPGALRAVEVRADVPDVGDQLRGVERLGGYLAVENGLGPWAFPKVSPIGLHRNFRWLPPHARDLHGRPEGSRIICSVSRERTSPGMRTVLSQSVC